MNVVDNNKYIHTYEGANKLTKALILCAGYGTRLGDLTSTVPKPMLPINGKPLLEYTVRHLASLGIQDLVINLHYLSEQIYDYFGDGSEYDVNIEYSYEEKPLGTAGALKNAQPLFNGVDRIFVLYGDIICNENYQKLSNLHFEKDDAVATIILHERLKSNSVVEIDDDNLITRFVERPKTEVIDKKQNWVNSGLYCFSRSIFNYIQEDSFCDFPKDVFPKLLSEKCMYGYALTGYRCAVDSLARYKQLQLDMESNQIFN